MKIRSPLLTKLAVVLGMVLMRLLFRTCRVEACGDVSGINPYGSTGPERYLYCVWHDQILMTVFSGRPQNMAGLVSRHQDGSYLADAMKLLGIAPVRGSTNRGGDRALRELIQKARDFHIAITPDGPRGPRHQIKSGIVFLASHAGRSIIPTAYACKRSWKIPGSWTDMMVPQPFTTIFVRGGAPMQVPPGLKREELEFYSARLQEVMERLEAEAARLAGGEEPPPSERKAAA